MPPHRARLCCRASLWRAPLSAARRACACPCDGAPLTLLSLRVLAPPAPQGVLNYLASEVHASYGPLFGPGSDEFKAAQKAKLATKFKYVDEQMLGEKPFLMGDHFTIVDACA